MDMSVLSLLLWWSIIATLLLLFLVLSGYLLSVSWTYWKYRHLPSPKRFSFLFGHIPNVYHSKSPMHRLYYEWYKEVGKLYVIFFIRHVFVITLNPDDIKILFGESFSKKPRKFVNYMRFICGQRLMGNGLISEPDFEPWKKKRRAYDHAFHKTLLKEHIPTMNYCAERTVKQIHRKIESSNEDFIMMKTFIEDYTADTICTIAFSADFEKSEELFNFSNFHASFQNISSLIENLSEGVKKNIHTTGIFQILHPFRAKSYQADAKKFREIGKRWILERIAHCNSGAEAPKDVLQFMIDFAKNNNEIGLEDLIDDFVTFYSAGQETTASLLCFAIVEIHQHPEILNRILTEISEVMKDQTFITNDHLQKLHYMEQVIMETLRCHPLVSSFIRESPKDGVNLSSYHIPQGTLISVNSILSTIPEYFEEADVFRPERFDKLNCRTISRYVYFPFGVGQRNCIGKHFAMMEAKIILTKLLLNFTFNLPQDYQLCSDSAIICHPQGKLPFQVVPKYS